MIDAALGQPTTTPIQRAGPGRHLLAARRCRPADPTFSRSQDLLDVPRRPIGSNTKADLAELLANTSSPNISGSTAPSETLDAITDALAGFLADELEGELRPIVAPHLVGRESLRLL